MFGGTTCIPPLAPWSPTPQSGHSPARCSRLTPTTGRLIELAVNIGIRCARTSDIFRNSEPSERSEVQQKRRRRSGLQVGGLTNSVGTALLHNPIKQSILGWDRWETR